MKLNVLWLAALAPLLILNSCAGTADRMADGIWGLLANNLKGIEKTLKQIYAFLPDEEGYRYATPHESEVISVNVALDRYYDTFKLVMEINLTNQRSLVIRDFNGKLKWFQIQKIGDYALDAYYYNPNIKKEHKRYGHTYHGVTLGDFSSSTGLKFKNIRQIIDNYDSLYAFIQTLPEITGEEHQFTISYQGAVHTIEANFPLDWTAKVKKLFNEIDPALVSDTHYGEKYILYKRAWTEREAQSNYRRISGELFKRSADD